MAEPNNPVNPKVTATAAGGSVFGGALAVVIIWLLQHIARMPADWFDPSFVVALTAVCTGATGFLCGYLRKHGIDVG